MFSRGSRTHGRHARDGRRGREQAGAGSAPDTGAPSDPDSAAAATDGAAATEAAGQFAGPYDSADAPTGGRRLDLGSLLIPSVPGVEVRVQTSQDGAVQQVYLSHGESLLQLAVFAAPRTESIWDEVRAEIHRSLATEGASVQERAGDYGTELQARVRTPQGGKDLRFVGVSGPRWLIRAVYQGPAAADPAQAGPLGQCLRGVVVARGPEARPAKEPLPLRLSEELAARLQARAVATGSGGAPAAAGAASSAGAAVNGGAPTGTKPSPRPRQD